MNPDDEFEGTDEERAALERLQRFRADDGRLSPESRARLWRQLSDDPEVRARIARHLMLDSEPSEPRRAKGRHRRSRDAESTRPVAPYASSASLTPVRGGQIVAGGPPARRHLSPLVMAVAAAVAVVALLGVTAPTNDAPEVSTDRAETPSVPEVALSLNEVAEQLDAIEEYERLGLDDAVYAHRVATVQSIPPGPEGPAGVRSETWIDADSAGRRVVRTGSGDPVETSFSGDGADQLLIGGGTMIAKEVLRLPTDATLVDRLQQLAGGADLVIVAVDLLAEAGIPPDIRGALVRLLESSGLRPVEDPGSDPTYEGSRPDGGSYRLTLDATAFVPVALAVTEPDGTGRRTAYEEIETRPDRG